MIYEQRTINGVRVETLKIQLDTPPEMLAQHSRDGYTEVLGHYLILYKPPQSVILKRQLDDVAAALPDEIAVEHLEIYPMWMDGMVLGNGDRVQYGGALYRVTQAHTAQSDWPPDTALPLFSRINAPEEIPAWVQGSYAKDVQVTHKSKVWLSMVDNNVWEPGAPGISDTIWIEVSI